MDFFSQAKEILSFANFLWFAKLSQSFLNDAESGGSFLPRFEGTGAMKLEITKDNLLASLNRAVFGTDLNADENRSRFLSHLLEFRKILSRRNERIISEAAIRNWFSESKTASPKQDKSLEFLSIYVIWVGDKIDIRYYGIHKAI